MTDARTQLEQRLNHLYDVLTRFDGLQQHRDAVWARHQHRYVPHKKRWGFGMGVLAFFAILAVTIFIAALTSDLWFLMTPPFTVGGAFLLVWLGNRKIVAKENAKREARNQQIANEIAAEVAPEIQQIEVQLAQTRQEYQANFRGWFPQKYLNSADVGACWHIVHDHRASTLESTLNVYETDLHRQRMENMAASQLAEQQRATRVAQTNGIINATMQGFTAGTIRAEGAATRAALNRPVNVNVRHR